jgi:hypothetical protein
MTRRGSNAAQNWKLNVKSDETLREGMPTGIVLSMGRWGRKGDISRIDEYR